MPKKPTTALQQLKSDFAVVADYFKMPEESRAAAWRGAVASPARSAACYRAIATSLAGTPSQSSAKQKE